MAAAYADVVSLMSTMRLLQSSSVAPQTLASAYKELGSLEDVLRRLDTEFGHRSSRSEKMHALDEQARDAVRKLEDTLDTLLYNHVIILPQSDHDQEITSLDDEWSSSLVLKQVWHPIKKLVKELEDYFQELKTNPLADEEEDDDDGDAAAAALSRIKMIGFSDQFEDIRHMALEYASDPEFASRSMLSISIFGMAGVGKTTMAREVFKHPEITSRFDTRLWVNAGPKCTYKGIIRRILTQLDPDNDHKMLMELGVKELGGYLKERLKDKRCFIVLDDLWNEIFCIDLPYFLSCSRDQSVVLVTTRLIPVASRCACHYMIALMDEEISWDLFCEKVFGEGRCPFRLEKAGKKIAENCEGLPLLIVQVAKLLCKAEKTIEYWNEVAEEKNSVFMDVHDQISHVLLPSYTELPTYFKASFVYMGVFPRKYEIPSSKLINLWCAEGFHPQFVTQPSENYGVVCIGILIDRNLIVTSDFLFAKKTHRLHYVFWHLCNREAEKNKFFHVLRRHADSFVDGIRSQRRLCIHNNVLFSIKDVYDSMASVETARSLLCTGPYHQYPVPVCFGLRLLRVLYALTIRFYEFPMEVVKLVLLRYLSLTYDGEIPPSLSKLLFLEYLTVHRHLSIKSSRDPSYLPIDIWDMRKLKHLEITGCDLHNPCGACLPNLLTLLDVSPQSCSKSVFEGLPKLRRLRIRIELELDATEPLSFFDHIALLHSLYSLKCAIVNPNLRPLQPSITIFSAGLTRLRLSGFGYPWEAMRVIASLPNLEVLKLRCYAFRGPKWDMTDDGLVGLQSLPTEDNTKYEYVFLKLVYLLIEDTDLMQWRITSASFPSLMRLTIKHCYKLEQIPLEFAHLESLRMIDLVDCSLSAVTSAKQVEAAKQTQGKIYFKLTLHCSWDDGNIKSRLAT